MSEIAHGRDGGEAKGFAAALPPTTLAERLARLARAEVNNAEEPAVSFLPPRSGVDER